MSRLIIEKNWNIGSLFKNYDGFDFTFSNQIIYDKIIYDKIIYDIWNPIITKTPREKKPLFLDEVDCYHDIMYPELEGKLWTRNELVFIKGNRDHVKGTKKVRGTAAARMAVAAAKSTFIRSKRRLAAR